MSDCSSSTRARTGYDQSSQAFYLVLKIYHPVLGPSWHAHVGVEGGLYICGATFPRT